MDPFKTIGAGLGYLGEAIDKPGRAVRGLLAGKAREGAAFLPFSDSLGITDHKDATSGRDLTDAYGITDKHSTSFGSSALGFGAGVLTDPLSWVGAGLAAKGAKTLGQGAKAAAKSMSGLDLLDAFNGGSKLSRADHATHGLTGIADHDAFMAGHRARMGAILDGPAKPPGSSLGGLSFHDGAGEAGGARILGSSGKKIGWAKFSGPGVGESGAARRIFPDAVRPGESVRRINETELASKHQGKGLGQALYLDMMGSHPNDWFYNSQASRQAALAADALERKGLIEHYRQPGHGERPHVGRITDAGLEMASHPDLLTSLMAGHGFPPPLPMPPRRP